MNVRPGLNINIVVNVDHMRETVDVGNSIIHEVREDVLIAAQTDPPISRTRLGQEVLVTFLDRSGGKIRRMGFPAIITGFITGYELNPSVKVQALALREAGGVEEHNLRMFFRLEPPARSGLTISIHGKQVNLIDVSIGGARFSYERSYPLKAGDDVTLTISMDTTPYSAKGRILRVWEPENERIRKTITMASMQFVDMEAHVKNILARKIRDIERELRYRDTEVAQ
jgi:hypothetical protein